MTLIDGIDLQKPVFRLSFTFLPIQSRTDQSLCVTSLVPEHLRICSVSGRYHWPAGGAACVHRGAPLLGDVQPQSQQDKYLQSSHGCGRRRDRPCGTPRHGKEALPLVSRHTVGRLGAPRCSRGREVAGASRRGRCPSCRLRGMRVPCRPRARPDAPAVFQNLAAPAAVPAPQ